MSNPTPDRRQPGIFRPVWLLVPLAILSILAGLVFFEYQKVISGPGAAAESFAYGSPAPSGTLPELWTAPSFSLVDQDGKVLTDGDLAGHPWIADFFYTTCTSACPTLSAKLVLLQRKLPEPDLRFVSFSVDPAHDTPEALATYRKAWGSDDARWLLLRTTKEELAKISEGMRVGVDSSGDPKNPILHTTLFFLVDRAGKVRGIYDSADSVALDRLTKDVRGLEGAPAIPARSGLSGKELYGSLGCTGCHENPKVAPELGGLAGTKVALEGGASITADAAYIRESLVAPGTKVAAGYLNLMPSYDRELSEDQLGRLVDYVASLPPGPDRSAAGPSTTRAKANSVVTTRTIPAPSAAAEATSLGVDPVCGMKIRITKDSPKADYAGRAYHFCSRSCRDMFLRDPRRYTAKAK